MERPIGICSVCGNTIYAPVEWASVVPYEPYCSYCGAIPADKNLPVIQMKPAAKPKVYRHWASDTTYK